MKTIFLDIDGVLKDVPNPQLSIGGWEISINTKTAVIPKINAVFAFPSLTEKKYREKTKFF